MIKYLEPVYLPKTKKLHPPKMEFLCGPRSQNESQNPNNKPKTKIAKEKKQYAKFWSHPRYKMGPTLKETSPRAKFMPILAGLEIALQRDQWWRTQWSEHFTVQYGHWVGEVEVLSHAGWWIGGIFLHEMKWDVFFLKPLKAPKNTHTKSDMIEKEWSFLSPNQMHIHLCLLTSYVSFRTEQQKKHKHLQISGPLGAAKHFPSLFFCVTFLGSEKHWSLRSGW